MADQERELLRDIKENPKSADAWHKLAVYYGENAEYTKAGEYYVKILNLNPSDTEALQGLGDVRARLGDTVGANWAYQRVLSLNADNEVNAWIAIESAKMNQEDNQVGPRDAAKWIKLAFGCFEAQQYAKCIAAFDKALLLGPIDADAWCYVGRTCYELKQLVRAELAFEKALELESSNAPAWRVLGIIRIDLHNFTGAIGALKKALALDPGDADAKECLAIAQTESKKSEQAGQEKPEKVSKSLIFKETASEMMSPEILGERFITMHQFTNVEAIEDARFPVNFRDIVQGSRRDLIYCYQERVPVRYAEDPNHPGYAIPVEFVIKVRKMDVVAFLAANKTKSTEFRVYQIGRRHE
ncbi:MAG: TPR repeat [Promethearchaeota archaeon CR_4]|nr:MAG: TPR repeat [Candidatus Lokiarchaeota archaeon CR_4]